MANDNHPLQTTDFDAHARLRQGRSDGSLTETQATMLRVLWLRQDVPQARIDTAMVRLDGDVVVMHATVALPDGGQGSAHAAIPLTDTSDLSEVIELAEMRSLARALDVLGYIEIDPPDAGLGFDEGVDEQDEIAIATAQRQPPEHVQALRQMKDRARSDSVGPQPPVDSTDRARTVHNRSEQTQVDAEAGVSPTVSPVDEDDPPLEDVSWTSFWGWARATYKLGSRGQLEQLLGQSVGTKSPGELRTLLHRHFQESNADGS